MAKVKFVYQSYDYSFLKPKDPWYIPICSKVYAKTIGYDIVSTQTMSEPTGQLFWIDPMYTTAVNTRDVTTDTTVSTSTSVTYQASNTSASKTYQSNYSLTTESLHDWIFGRK